MLNKKPVLVLGGIGPGSLLSIELIRIFSKSHFVVGLARKTESIQMFENHFTSKDDVVFIAIDLLDPSKVQQAVEKIESEYGAIDSYIHLAGLIALKPFLETPFEDFKSSLNSNFFSSVEIIRQILKKMIPREKGNIILSGATSSVRGGARSSAFASGKFALRGLSQALAREFGPKGIHVAHIVVDGVIEGQRAQDEFKIEPSKCINPKALAKVYLDICNQDPSAWTLELDVRPFSEKF